MSDKDQSTHRAGGEHGPPSVSPKWSKVILGTFAAGGVILFLLDFVIHRHVEHPWENIPGFYSVFGFLGVAGLIFAAKELRKIVARGEDYYDGE